MEAKEGEKEKREKTLKNKDIRVSLTRLHTYTGCSGGAESKSLHVRDIKSNISQNAPQE